MQFNRKGHFTKVYITHPKGERPELGAPDLHWRETHTGTSLAVFDQHKVCHASRQAAQAAAYGCEEVSEVHILVGYTDVAREKARRRERMAAYAENATLLAGILMGFYVGVVGLANEPLLAALSLGLVIGSKYITAE